ncbi:hypothetical protein D5086_009882 [Populus alba]|uniref:Uncharacterized protein n=1 Tax=Populus alba TaxID=43335 RepID=A0ACC4C7T1_POPAL
MPPNYSNSLFEDVLKELWILIALFPICVISDMFLPWTVDSCCLFDIPRIVFSGHGCVAYVPFPLNKTDFPDHSCLGVVMKSIQCCQLFSEIEQAEHNSWGYVVNSFEELEGPCCCLCKSHMRPKQNGLWVHFCFMIKANKICMNSGSKDVDQKQFRSISQMGRIAPWVGDGRTAVHLGGSDQEHGSHQSGGKTGSRREGCIRDWVDQRGILEHPAIGGTFLTHCGWNFSVWRACQMGVPLLAWPMGAEQGLNAR